jgi:hypothetical protein
VKGDVMIRPEESKRRGTRLQFTLKSLLLLPVLVVVAHLTLWPLSTYLYGSGIGWSRIYPILAIAVIGGGAVALILYKYGHPILGIACGLLVFHIVVVGWLVFCLGIPTEWIYEHLRQ